MAQRPFAGSAPPDVVAPGTGGIDLLPQQRIRRRGAPGSLTHACGVAVSGLVLCALLVGGAALVALCWDSSVVLAVVCLVALLAAGGTGVAFLMTRPPHRSART